MLASELACIPGSGPTDAGRGIIATLLQGAAVAAAAYNTVKAVEIALDEWDLAKRYWQIAENWLDIYRDMYAPVEDQELTEAKALEEPEPFFDVARGRARVIAWLGFRDVLNKSIRCTSRYCTGLRADMLVDLATAQADAVALADGLGYRNERGYLEARDDVRFDKQLNTVKRGRDMIASNVSMAKASADIYGDMFDQAWKGLVGAGQYLGYSQHRMSIPTRVPRDGSENLGENYLPSVDAGDEAFFFTRRQSDMEVLTR